MARLLSIVLFILPMTLAAQLSNFEWAKSFDVSSSHFTSAMVTDSSNNVYFCGRYEDTLDADPSSGVYNLISNGGYDIFVVKLDQDGNLVWAISLGGTGFDSCLDMDIDSNQNILLVGGHSTPLDFDPGPGINMVNPPGTSGECYILKLDSDANFIWVKTLLVGVYGISVDINNDLCLTGGFEGTTDFDPGPGTYNVTPPYFPVYPPNIPQSVFVLKLDSNGNFIWVRQLNGPSFFFADKIETDNSANILFTGLFKGYIPNDTIDMDPGPGTFWAPTHPSYFFGFTEKLDPNGNFEWASVLSSGYNTRYGDVDTDIDGNVYMHGEYYDTTDVDPGPAFMPLVSTGSMDVLIQKLAPDGTLIWVKNIGGPNIDSPAGIHVDDDKIYLTGIYQDSMDFDPNAGVEARISNGYQEGYALCLDTSSSFNWVKSIGGIYYDRITDIVTDTYKNVYFVGRYQVAADLNPDAPVQMAVATQWNSGNPYVEKINRCYLKPYEEVVAVCDSFTWLNGVTYTADELVSINMPEAAANGCDSVLHLELNILNTSGTDTISACKSYTWIDGNTYTLSNNTATFTLTNSAGCDSVVTLNLTIDTVDTSLSNNSPNLLANAQGATFQWIDCDSMYAPIIGDTNSGFTAESNGYYAVVIDQSGCIDTSACVLVNNIGLEEYMIDQPYIYPNPGRGSYTIDIGELVEPELIIHSSNGKLIYRKEHITDQTFEFNMDEAEGIYFVELTDNSRTIKFKVVKL